MRLVREKRLPQRILIYCLGLFSCALGVAMAVNSGLGAGAPSAFSYTLSLIFVPSMGMLHAMALVILVLLQILILRRDFKWINLTQLLVAVLFGFFIDLCRFLVGDFQLPTYFGRLTMILVAIVFNALGISLFSKMRFVNLPVESLAFAIAEKTPSRSFPRAKIYVDCTYVILAISFSLVFLGGVYGLREGTVLAAVMVGKLLPYTDRAIAPLIRKLGIES